MKKNHNTYNSNKYIKNQQQWKVNLKLTLTLI